MSYADLDNPELHHQTKLYTGNGTSGTAITFDGSENMQPDWIWGSCRSVGDNNWMSDSVRGNTKALFSNNSNGEETSSERIKSFDSNGFTIGDAGDTNTNTRTFVTWNWKAGGSASSNSNGNITSSVSANTTAGFSIVSYTGNETSGATIGHGLGAVPSMIMAKRRNSGNNWGVYHHRHGNNKGLYLDENGTGATSSAFWNDTTPTSTVFTLGDSATVNGSSDTYIAYCFADVKGYSRISSFVGNADTDGPWVFCGFRPSFVLIKNTSASEHWRIYDNKRDTYNHMYHVIYANDNGAESTVNNASEEIDFLSTGFKIRSSAAQLNGSGNTIFFMAFAEAPFVNSKNVPNNAR